MFAHARYIRLRTIYNYGDVTLRWRTSTEALWWKPPLDEVQWDYRTILSHLHNYGAVFTHYTVYNHRAIYTLEDGNSTAIVRSSNRLSPPSVLAMNVAAYKIAVARICSQAVCLRDYY